MLPLFFGPSSRQLYGVYHPPLARPVRSVAVLMVPGLGHEYMRAHRAFARLAGFLAQRGFPVLRYDHEGTGDSAGEMDLLRIQTLSEGLLIACEELDAMAEVPRVALVGHRLGAWLALQAAPRLPCRAIAACDPVLDGAAYVRRLSDLAPPRTSSGEKWVLGFPWSAGFLSELERVVRPGPMANGAHVLAFTDRPEPGWTVGEWQRHDDDLLAPGPLVVPYGDPGSIASFLEVHG